MKVKEISLKNAIAKFESKDALFIDARPPDDFKRGHIKGAINLSEKKYNEWIDDFISNTDINITIITYCDGVNCKLAQDLAEKLYFSGFENVYFLTDGWRTWNKNSQPIDSDPE